jgi:hypothetical protein
MWSRVIAFFVFSTALAFCAPIAYVCQIVAFLFCVLICLSFYRTTNGGAAVSSVTGTLSKYDDGLMQLPPVFDLPSTSRDNSFVDFFDSIGQGLEDFGEVVGCDFGADKYTIIRLPVIVFDSCSIYTVVHATDLRGAVPFKFSQSTLVRC